MVGPPQAIRGLVALIFLPFFRDLALFFFDAMLFLLTEDGPFGALATVIGNRAANCPAVERRAYLA